MSWLGCLQWEHKKFLARDEALEGACKEYVGGPRDIWTKCDPEVFWESVTKAAQAFQGVWAEQSHVPALVLNDRYGFTTTKHVSPHRISHVSPCQSPKFLSCSFIVLQHTALTPPHLHCSLWIKDMALDSQKTQQQETGKAVWIWQNSSSLTSAQAQRRTTQRGLTECNFKTDRSYRPGRGGQNILCFLSLHVLKEGQRSVQLWRLVMVNHLNHKRISMTEAFL